MLKTLLCLKKGPLLLTNTCNHPLSAGQQKSTVFVNESGDGKWASANPLCVCVRLNLWGWMDGPDIHPLEMANNVEPIKSV